MMRRARRMLRSLACALVLGCVVVFAAATFAATTVTDAYDQPSSTTLSAASNHSFTFTTASAAIATNTITFVFETGFVLTSITEDDVDITDDSTDQTTAANCAGTEQVGVAISSQTLTLTMCTGTTIASGSVVNVEIGTNATSSGTGANQITNPSAAATYFVNLAGTFGGSASFPVPILTDDNSGVSANVVSGTSGGSAPSAPASPSPSPSPEPEPEPEPTTDTTEEGDTEADTTTDTGEDTGDSTVPSESAESGTSDSGAEGTTTSEGEASGGETSGAEADASESASETTTPTVEIDVFIITPGGITLSPDSGTFDALAGTETTLVVIVDTTATVEDVRVNVDGTEYVLAPQGDGTFTGDIVLPRADGSIDIIVDTIEAPTTYETYYVDARGSGLVYERINNSRVAVGGAVVTVYEVVDGARVPWAGSDNPFVVDASGSFAFYVPNGTYVVTAGKAGYEDGESGTLSVRDHILAPVIELVLLAEEAPVTPTTPAVSAPLTAVSAFVAMLGEIVATPEVQTAIDIAKPVTIVLAATSVVVLASSFSLFPFLQYLFTAPILFFARRKRKAFGVVYSAATKLPVDLAIVRMFAMPERRLVRSVVTDAKGRYLLAASPGIYAIEVTKRGFAFPSELLNGKKDDGTYLDVYTGQQIEVTERDATISANIPVDPAETAATETPRTIALRRFLRVLQHTIAVVGIALAFSVLVLSPSIFTALMVGIQTVVYILARRLARPRKAKGWGIVYDAVTRAPVGNAVVRLFEPTYNKLVESVVTDHFGRYAFLVGPSEYYVTYDKPGYAEKIVKPIDYRTKTEPSALALDVPLEEAVEDV